jgi:F0F1-type ATP synthase beta subunit
MANYGKVTQVIGPVVDVAFDDSGSKLPNILIAFAPVFFARFDDIGHFAHRMADVV